MRVVIALLCLVAAVSATSHLRTAFKRGQAVDTYDNGLILPRFREMVAAGAEPNWNIIKAFKTAHQFATTGRMSNKQKKTSQQMQKNLNTQLSRDGRKEVFDEFLQFYADVAGTDAKNNELWDKALHGMLKLLYLASQDDPTYYVSHAADHGIRVDLIWERHLRTLRGVIKSLRKQFFNIDMKTTVQDTEKKPLKREAKPDLQVPVDLYCRLIVGIAHVLHDVGYSGLPHGMKANLKWTHAINGAELIKKTLSDSLGKVIPAEHFNIIVEAVRYHNADATKCLKADEKSCQYPDGGPYNDETHEAFFAKDGVGAVGKNSIKELMVRKYVAASLDPDFKPPNGEFNPVLWLLRFADNGDASRFRLTTGQRDKDVMACWRDLALDCGVTTSEQVQSFKTNGDTCKAVKDHKKQLWDDLINQVAVNEFSFLHYYSNYVVKRMFWSKLAPASDTVFTGTMDVEFYTDMDEGLAIEHLKAAAAYQINRFAEAAESLFFGANKDVTSQVTINLKDFPTAGKTLTLPLAAFNKDTAKKNSDNCKKYNDNFASGQKCFTKGKITSNNADAFSKNFPKCQ